MIPSNLNLYYIFYVTAQSANISTAAKRLYISQPAVSKSISRLEESLDTLLFIRSSRGVKLTPEGALLFQELQSAFQSIEKGEDAVKKSVRLGIGRLSIGASTTLCKYVLLPRLPEFIQENPYVKLSISCQPTHNTLHALELEELDVGITGEPERAGAFRFYPIRTIHDILVTTKQYLNWLTLQEKEISLENTTLLLLDKNNITRRYVENYLLNRHLSPASILEISTMDLLIEFARAGLGVACVIEEFVEKELAEGTLIRFPQEHEIPPRKIGFACKNSTNPTPVVQKFMKLFIPDSGDLE